jgi:NitT/TauT family transport system substrate-binding protein
MESIIIKYNKLFNKIGGEQQMKKRTVWISSILSIFMLLAACGTAKQGDQSTSAQSNKASQEIKIGYVNILSMAPAIIAQKKGLMEKQGLKSQYFSFGNGPDLYKALASGKVDVAYAGVPAGVNWASRGANVKAIAKVDNGKFGLIAGPKSGIQNANDLKGKKLGTDVTGSGVDILMRGFLLPEAKLTEKDVTLTQMQMPNMVQAVKQGTIDGAVAGEPYLTMAELQGEKVVKDLPDPAVIVIASDAFLKNHPDEVKKFLKGHIAAIQFINQNKDQASQLLASSFNMPSIKQGNKTWTAKDIIKKALDRQSYDATITKKDFAFYQQVADADYKLKLITSPFNVKKLFDTSWLQAVAGK